MKSPQLTEIERFYGSLPLGVVLLNSAFQAVYRNKVYTDIMRYGEAEFGSREAAHRAFIGDAERNRNKKTSTIRFLAVDGLQSVVVSVYQSVLTQRNGERYTVVSLILRGPGQVAAPELPSDIYIHGILRVNVASQTAFVGRRLLPLTHTEMQLLVYFCRNEGRVISKGELMKNVWHKRAMASRTVDVFVSKLRRKLAQHGFKTEAIRTMHGIGYIFVGNS